VISTWRIATDTPEYEADDLSGAGAKKSGGRWNRAGTALVYTSASIALACLEAVVHLGAGNLPLNRYLVLIDIPDEVWQRRESLSADLIRVGWDALPVGRVSLDVGDIWINDRSSCVLEVPSVIIPEEMNVLINPAHPGADKLTATKIRWFQYDMLMRG